MILDGSNSYHDAWYRNLNNGCQARFQDSGIWVEGQGGIQSDQYLRIL